MSTSAKTTTQTEQLVRPATSEETRAIAFPESGYVGVAAKFADVYSEQYESPKEFFYIDCLALIGASISGRVRADFDLPCQPRLYVLKVAKSAWLRKSTSTQFADKFVRSALEIVGPDKLLPQDWPKVVYGVGSAEGLAKCLMPPQRKPREDEPEIIQTTYRVALVFDEFRRFEAKAGIQNAALRPMVNELYERNEYDNLTLSNLIHIVDGHLAFLANSTEETYKNLLDAAEFRDIGFLNRLFLVTSESRKRVAKPKMPPESVLAPIRAELAGYIASLPPLNEDGSANREVVIPLTNAAEQMWNDWYLSLDETDETARLDNLGMRLMGLLAFSSGRSVIDEELLRSVLDILGYEEHVRSVYRPIEATNDFAKMEQKIRLALKQRGRISKRDIRRYTNADRHGLRVFKWALSNLVCSGEVRIGGDNKCELIPQTEDE